MRTQFYIIRHGRTLFNDKKLIQGSSDSPLTKEGVIQAGHLCDHLRTIPFQLGASSTSERAMDTLEIIADHRFPTEYLKGLKEVSFGTLEGDPLIKAFPEGKLLREGYEAYGGETPKTAERRFEKTLRQIAVDGNILIVSHGAVILEFLRTLSTELRESEEFPGVLVPNCSVTKVLYEQNTFTLETMPDASMREA